MYEPISFDFFVFTHRIKVHKTAHAPYHTLYGDPTDMSHENNYLPVNSRGYTNVLSSRY